MAATKKQATAKATVKSAANRHARAGRSASPPAIPPNPAKGVTGRKRGPAAKEWNFTHQPPGKQDRAKNGRCAGRNLITWNRPKMAEKLLLHLQYECARYAIDLPWDSIAHRLHPGSSGGAVLQYLNRLRPMLIGMGHMVPPVPQKPGSRANVDPKVRGLYLIDRSEHSDRVSTRPVLFSEPLEDADNNLPDWEGIKATKPARKTAPAKSVKVESPDPDEGDGDAEWTPTGPVPHGRHRRSGRPKAATSHIEQRTTYDSAEEEEADSDEEYAEESDDEEQGGLASAADDDDATVPKTASPEAGTSAPYLQSEFGNQQVANTHGNQHAFHRFGNLQQLPQYGAPMGMSLTQPIGYVQGGYADQGGFTNSADYGDDEEEDEDAINTGPRKSLGLDI